MTNEPHAQSALYGAPSGRPPRAGIPWRDILYNEFLRNYLTMLEETESPRLMHIWSAVAGLSAALARRCWFRFGADVNIWPNVYVFLVGQPGVRKSTAINLVTSFLRSVPAVLFAPEDISGDRRNLIEAMDGSRARTNLRNLDVDQLTAMLLDTSVVARPLFMQASELPTLLGYGQMELITFLTKMWDGENYTYSAGKTERKLLQPLATLIGGTTPALLSHILPTQAIGQGFLSRVILVYAGRKYKDVVRPTHVPEDWRQYCIRTFWNAASLTGQMTEDTAAARALDALYGQAIPINDPRFIGYKERRHTHLIKLSMCLAAARASVTITEEDVADASNILTLTEQDMPEALGEFGLSPLAAARQKLLEFLQFSDTPVPHNLLWNHMRRDMRLADFEMTVREFVADRKVREVVNKDGTFLMFIEPRIELKTKLENAVLTALEVTKKAGD